VSGAELHMEANFGGRFWRQVSILRQILEASFNVEVDPGGGFACRGRLWRRFFH
jgi:hypothetical protein